MASKACKDKKFKMLTIYGYVRELSNKYKMNIPSDISKIILFFYAIWNKLSPAGTPTIARDVVLIQQTMWYSTRFDHGEQGMVQYDIKSDSIINIVKYPQNIRPAAHAICCYKDKIFMINGWNGEIILFDPSTQIFTKKLTITRLGASAVCVVIHDCIHIFNGRLNTKHMIYSISNNNIITINDPTTTTEMSAVCLAKYNNKCLKFGGWNVKEKQAMDEFWISSEIKDDDDNDEYIFLYNDIKWTLKEEWKLLHGLDSCGTIVYNNWVVTFGGTVADDEYIDSIFVLNLQRNDGWKETKHIKCPIASQYRGILDDSEDEVHLFTRLNQWPDWEKSIVAHYSIPIKQIIGDV